MNEIGRLLDFPVASKGVGSSVQNDFVLPLVAACNLSPASNKYRNVEQVIEHLGGTYDPWTDTSEKKASGGGGTITNPCLRKIRNLILAVQSTNPSSDISGQPAQAIVGRVTPLTATTLDPETVQDERQRWDRALTVRKGSGQWRKAILDVFDGRCAVTGWDVPGALDAAHIIPYKGPSTNVLGNGLLLRSDVHSLFDKGLLTIGADEVVRLHESLQGTLAWPMDGTKARLPSHKDGGPDRDLLAWHAKNLAKS